MENPEAEEKLGDWKGNGKRRRGSGYPLEFGVERKSEKLQGFL